MSYQSRAEKGQLAAAIHLSAQQLQPGDVAFGSSANPLLGYDGNDTLQGGEGADSLVGGEGVGRLDGGNGDDSYLLGDLDLIIELVGGGTDTGLSSVSYTLPGTVENLTLLGNGDLTATGNALANVLTGNGGGNLLRGLGEADRLSGGQGADTIEGGAGADTLTGSGGFETPAEGSDVVMDFRPGDDLLAFVAVGFGGLGVVTLRRMRRSEVRRSSSTARRAACWNGTRTAPAPARP